MINNEGVLTLKTILGNLCRVKYLETEDKEEVQEIVRDIVKVILRLQDQ